MKMIAKAFLGLTGQEIASFSLSWNKPVPDTSSVFLSGPAVETAQIRYMKEARGHAPGDVTSVSLENDTLTIAVEPCTNKAEWTLHINGEEYTRSSFTVQTRTADDKFTRHEEGRIMYRLYSPDSAEPRPMILFLHGGGNGGFEGERNNETQLMADYGPVNFAENYPDVYVMAPMCVEERKLLPNGGLVRIPFADSDFTNDWRYGWSRYYLAGVCDIIRRMIREGKVDSKRIYVTGMSMGGGGTIRALSVASDLFAAAIPVCPSMTPETFAILKSVRIPVWVTSSYIDHTLYRHKYLIDAVMAMRDAGNQNAHLTLFSPEDLEKYDIAITPGESLETMFHENHWSWVPTYKNDSGIMSWLFNQKKD